MKRRRGQLSMGVSAAQQAFICSVFEAGLGVLAFERRHGRSAQETSICRDRRLPACQSTIMEALSYPWGELNKDGQPIFLMPRVWGVVPN